MWRIYENGRPLKKPLFIGIYSDATILKFAQRFEDTGDYAIIKS